ncbi:MAG: methyltransferase domain-containing protein [Pseudomonadota bacterium]|nr:methyltransferase domain-containing protein [Pseudomonadota bacterium]
MKGSDSEFEASGSELFKRLDESPDEKFYSTPRLVHHIDDEARLALSEFYKSLLITDSIVLDLMSSWTSHLPVTPKPAKVVGHGMNKEELAANPILDNYFIQNLNKTAKLPLKSNTYDVCLLSVSVQYLTDPLSVFSEVSRILKPEGSIVISFSNRMFPTKAVAIWRALNSAGHGKLLVKYLENTTTFRAVTFTDISPNKYHTDPLFVVTGKAI